MSTKVISILGATGAQGSSVVEALVRNPAYTVRAITRNPDSEKAKKLTAKGAQVVQADANDVASLVSAFEGSYAIYAVTDFFEPFSRFDCDPAKAMEVEVQHGINMAKAAIATPTLQHYIWSSLPNAKKISGGQFLVPHFESKNQIDAYIKSQPELLAKTTFFWISFYASNLGSPVFTPIYVPTAKKYIQIQSVPGDTPVLSIGDVQANLGRIVKSILDQPGKTQGKFVLAHVEESSAEKFVQTWADAQGAEVQYLKVDREAFNALWPGWSQEIGVMMEFWAWAGDKSWSGEVGILTAKDLGVHGLVGLKESMMDLKY